MATASFALDSASSMNGTEEESFISTFFVRALYDYQSQDPSSLSFFRNDIIEVLTRLDSGWWDGLLGDERGWFPSNYVQVISTQEAEAALGSLEGSASIAPSETRDSMVDMGDAMGASLDQESEWSDAGIDLKAATAMNRSPSSANSTTTDFWVPQVTADGQVFYVNTQTGQQSRDLPHETDGDISDTDLSTFSVRNGSHNGSSVALNGMTQPESDNYAGFGALRRSGTPEPWARCLADDGLAYYYRNKKTGEMRWTLPEANSSDNETGAMPSIASKSSVSLSSMNSDFSRDQDTFAGFRSETSPSRTKGTSLDDRDSVISDDSDIHPNAQDGAAGLTPLQRSIQQARRDGTLELTAAEQAAQALQQAMAPPLPQSIAELTADVQSAIAAVVDFAQQPDLAGNPVHLEGMNARVSGVIDAVRDLLYIAALPSGSLPADLLKEGGDARSTLAASNLQTQLKPAQRKVTATLSKLVLSTRAFRSDSESPIPEATARLEADALELDKALQAFVMDVHRFQRHSRIGVKRVRGVFSSDKIGLGLYGGGSAGSWKGFGWGVLEKETEPPSMPLGTDVVESLRQPVERLSVQLASFSTLVKTADGSTTTHLVGYARDIIREFAAFLRFVADVHAAKHVDIDGIQQEPGQSPAHDMYMQSVTEARELVRTLEAAVQAIYDDSSSLLVAAQGLRQVDHDGISEEYYINCRRLNSLASTLDANASLVFQTLDALVNIGLNQANIAGRDHRQSILWRESRRSMIETRMRSLAAEDEVVGMEDAFSPKGVSRFDVYNAQDRPMLEDIPPTPTWNGSEAFTEDIPKNTKASVDDLPDEEDESDPETSLKPRRKGAKNKLKDFFGVEPIELKETEAPWYMKPDYSPNDINIDPVDGSTKAGTISALIERLTAHDLADVKLPKEFMLTWKSFTELDTLFNCLVQRYRMQPPDGLKSEELDDWTKHKHLLVRARVLNTFMSLVKDDDDVLEKEDLYIFQKLKDFLNSDDVKHQSAAKQCLILLDRAESGEGMSKRTIVTQEAPPPPIIPRSLNKKLKLLDIDPTELARQLTIMESQLYLKIRPMECMQRSREQRSGKVDHIAGLIQSTNLIAIWVADMILSREDSKRRAAVVKHFIQVADRCLNLRNFNTMIALVSGLNGPAIRRLKRTWEQVNQRTLSQLEVCEWTMDSGKNFNNYRTTLNKVTPPCVPFFGVYLTQLTFIQDGNPDNLDNLINFSKRHKAAEVISDIKRWQTRPYNLQPIAGVISFIDESLNTYADSPTSFYNDQFWNISLEREPREREDEKMARLLQESGFL